MNHPSKDEEKPAITQQLLLGGAIVAILMAIGLFLFQAVRSGTPQAETVAIPVAAQQAMESSREGQVPRVPRQLPSPPPGPPPGALIQPKPK